MNGTKEMRGGCWAITGNISEKISMCNLGIPSVKIGEARHFIFFFSNKKKKEKKKKKAQLSCISQDLATLPHVLHRIPFSWNCIRTRLVPTILHCIAQLLPNNCTWGHSAQLPANSWPTSVLGDVAHPRQGLISTLLNDLQVTHLLSEKKGVKSDWC